MRISTVYLMTASYCDTINLVRTVLRTVLLLICLLLISPISYAAKYDSRGPDTWERAMAANPEMALYTGISVSAEASRGDLISLVGNTKDDLGIDYRGTNPYEKDKFKEMSVSTVLWLSGSVLIGFVGFARRTTI